MRAGGPRCAHITLGADLAKAELHERSDNGRLSYLVEGSDLANHSRNRRLCGWHDGLQLGNRLRTDAFRERLDEARP